MDGISKKIYLELQAPTEDDNRSDQRRIQDGLKEQGIETKVSLRVLRKLYPLCEEAEWKVTVSLAWESVPLVCGRKKRIATSPRWGSSQ